MFKESFAFFVIAFAALIYGLMEFAEFSSDIAKIFSIVFIILGAISLIGSVIAYFEDRISNQNSRSFTK